LALTRGVALLFVETWPLIFDDLGQRDFKNLSKPIGVKVRGEIWIPCNPLKSLDSKK
jgi:hypothetical protein